MKAAGDMERRRQTEELRRYDIEGAVLETELCLDELTGLYIEILPDLIEKPVLGVCRHEKKRKASG